jgi:BirA family biotin operon repressor/biotin-[acetyl-CoA-carboxylase] ligase
MLHVSHIRANLRTSRLGREITYYPSTGSTNDDLWALWDAGEAATGRVVVTDKQLSGKGRQGRGWFSAPELGLSFSVLLRPELPVERLGLLSLAMGVAVVDALAADGVSAQLKWPNDILVDPSGRTSWTGRRKLGGILAESRTANDGPVVVMGVGINVNEQPDDFPKELHATAVSVRMVLGKPVRRELLLARILNRLEGLLESELTAVVFLWQERCAHIGFPVQYHGPRGLVEGRFLGVNEAGQGKITVGDRTHVVSAGDMDWTPH